MAEIAHGITVYFEVEKETSNIVFFNGETVRYYSSGDMLLEMYSTEAIFMLNQKVMNMIMGYPNYNEELDRMSITNGFKWLYGTIEDEELPVATELFRSSFDEAIVYLCNNTTEDEYRNVGDFLTKCYGEYQARLQLMYDYVDSIAAEASGVANDDQAAISSIFYNLAEGLYDGYSKKCSVRHKNGRSIVETVHIENFIQLLLFEYCVLKKKGKVLKQCLNCGRLFIPEHRKDTMYCNETSPQNDRKVCREIGAQIKRKEKRKANPAEREHYNTTCRLYNAIRRADGNADLQKHYSDKLEIEIDRFRKVKGGF